MVTTDRKRRRRKDEPDPTGFDCSIPGCGEEGNYKAPKSPTQLHDYRWLCLHHVREFNANWNYFDGMSASQVDAFMRDAPLGHRPTWKINRHAHVTEEKLHAAINDMMYGSAQAHKAERDHLSRKRRMTDAQRKALAVLDLDAEATLHDIKKQYKVLVKKHHPDVNPGDARAEDRFKRITGAYQELLKLYIDVES